MVNSLIDKVVDLKGRTQMDNNKETIIESSIESSKNMDSIPLELFEKIALDSPKAWKAMLSVPAFGRLSLTTHARRMALKTFTMVDNERKKSGNIVKCYTFMGKLHREGDLPAVVEKNREGKIVSLHWFLKGIRDRHLGPALLRFNSKGEISMERWYLQGLRGREKDLPGEIRYCEGKVVSKKWYHKGKLHRSGKPAYKHKDLNGIKMDMWYHKGQLHREEGPAVMRRCGSGLFREWYQEGIKTEADASFQIGNDLLTRRFVY